MGDNDREKKIKECEEKKLEGEEGKKKVGRLRKIEELGKERRSSTGCIEDFLKRKREGLGDEEKEVEEWVLRRSRRTEK